MYRIVLWLTSLNPMKVCVILNIAWAWCSFSNNVVLLFYSLRDSFPCFGHCIVIHSHYKSQKMSIYLTLIPAPNPSLLIPAFSLKESAFSLCDFPINIKDVIGWNTELKCIVMGRRTNLKEQEELLPRQKLNEQNLRLEQKCGFD